MYKRQDYRVYTLTGDGEIQEGQIWEAAMWAGHRKPVSYTHLYVDTNIKGTLNVLQAARDLGTEKIMVTSTSEVYGTAQYVPCLLYTSRCV